MSGVVQYIEALSAIALIVLLGLLAIGAAMLLAWVILVNVYTWYVTRRQRRYYEQWIARREWSGR